MVNEIIMVSVFILALIIVGVKIFQKSKKTQISTDQSYSTETFAIININEKASYISDWVHSICPEKDYRTIYNQIRSQLEEDN